ncbi:MAG: MarR family transcriptional regulator [Coprococcus sp.]|nr:MarR family transcriptional regulator [Coprococcus sp.]
MQELLENYSAGKELYARICDKVCVTYQMTRAEFHVLMFLANNPECSTATEIVEKRHLSKSHVSLSVRTLQERGFLRGEYRGKNRRTIHLTVCDAAAQAVADGRKAQEEFARKLLDGFSDEEKRQFERLTGRITANIFSALK